jgi:F-type H+-transporting ATPase subunit delta
VYVFSDGMVNVPHRTLLTIDFASHSVQVNIAAETGDMGVLANHAPSIEQLKPGLVEVIEESGGSKQFFRTCKINSSMLVHTG